MVKFLAKWVLFCFFKPVKVKIKNKKGGERVEDIKCRDFISFISWVRLAQNEEIEKW